MKKRKIYLASFFVALFLLVLTGCSQKSQEIPTKKVTVVILKQFLPFSSTVGAPV